MKIRRAWLVHPQGTGTAVRYAYLPVPDHPVRARPRDHAHFHLAPGSPADPLIGSLMEMDIANPKPFEALSYVWGPDTTTEDIICDDAALSILSNVARILRKIRYSTQPCAI